MKKYELGILTDPEKTDEEFQEIQKEVEDLITKQKGTIENVDLRGKRRLAYPIKKYQYAQYTFFRFNMPEGGVTTLERNLNLTPTILRSLIVKHENFQTIKADDPRIAGEDQKDIKTGKRVAMSTKKEVNTKKEESKPVETVAKEETPKDEVKEKPAAEKKEVKKKEKTTSKKTEEKPKKSTKKAEESTKTQLKDLDKKLDEILEQEIS